ncbi:carbamoyl phosphate synthase large subunit [candidate division WOR-1 bacterium RIFOXYA12_FULL_52_29]|uniref:Carbamoyl phosphate synthase large chain n=1 Tax=candidate division WOR-1 bacterium RIFOXYC12_FULL_54_18 TaxID=1802584 RepID=A0A1F4T6G9_UNCSA|nr:MAG: carbamoyl phosphate synthase large subunit [candidate division WOR-1 bacterium RIFOXYA2_FULL_51_19]OGC17256.1 MAG: carbamoyl phosphate synthase large subunit [candidate division WOR-1 bacterium RIFOXYA12_FULL_52_29]OGC26116.1 MAG: carbamoyl phosphate synthase large subunit [candidate division WOR-1 bacterium RIFOXYB2_FULL_45_9]OGC27673.1 MAG: carbamoyl phosphate synthase large subunit [candidate division WOR-1 bacterium RIFOXYC12_FULL_54_18]OGC29114.1 MAG: carbamoyl phosphate synthase l
MPKRTDIKKIMIIGAGPIVIGQACEFDYSGSQACKALREEGYEVVLINSNPATIMTDPELAHRTYIEPITPEMCAKIIEKERPDALLPTLGGQTALNTAVKLAEMGVLEKYKVEVIGANIASIKMAEERDLFKQAMEKAGLDVPKSGFAHNMEEARATMEKVGLPVIIRPSFTLGGTGSGIAYNIDEFEQVAKLGLELSPVSEILIEENLTGWKEYELEVMRDKKDNVVIICSIENFDPMGVHTGDSITVAPAQTLTDREYQNLRDQSIAVIRAIGVETGGSNIQFAVNPDTGRIVIIEMNPRVSRSSALASKATGFPIAKFAAKLAVGYTLDEIPNDITKETPASFEPSIDYCVIKIPRFTFEKFPDAEPVIGTSMKSVGETMAIGRTFKEALQKGLRSLEIGRAGLGADGKDEIDQEMLNNKLTIPNPDRIFYVKHALQTGMSMDEIFELSKIDRWFLQNMKEIIDEEKVIRGLGKKVLDDKEALYKAKQFGFSDKQLAYLTGETPEEVRKKRKELGVAAVYKLVDTCAAEFEAYTPYYYSTYETECEVRSSQKKKIMILGGGPNRIGQGIEFDYCCVHASFAIREEGLESIMVNSNPETVSTDYDTSDRLYFEPVTVEDVLNIVDKEKPDGVIVQFGGQTPLNIALALEKAGVPIIGTSPASIDRAEDRKRFAAMLRKLKLNQPPNGTATSKIEAKKIANRIGYPVLVRPSYVLGGRAMRLVYGEDELEDFMQNAVKVSPEHPILVDKFLDDAIEVDVDCVSDGKQTMICGIMEHIEEAGIHSGDSACSIPPYSLSKSVVETIKKNTYAMAKELKVIGLMNTQFAIKGGKVYVLEVNPRASRTVPFVSKATGIPWAKVATKVMLGKSLKEQKISEVEVRHFSVKEAVFPFNRFPGVDAILGPEMKSTGEVMGIDDDFGSAFMKSQIAAGQRLPLEGKVFVSVKDKDKRSIVYIVKHLVDLGFKIVATPGTADVLKKSGIEVQEVYRIGDGRPDITDLIKNNEINLIINTPSEIKKQKQDESKIRFSAVVQGIPLVTTISGAQATINGIEAAKKKGFGVKALQDYH